MCDLGLMTGEGVTGGLDCPDCGQADCDTLFLRLRGAHRSLIHAPAC